MFTLPKQVVSDFTTVGAGCHPPHNNGQRKGATFLAIALTRVPTRPEHMWQTKSGYNICHFALIKTLSAGFAAAPYKNADANTRADPAKMQMLNKLNREGLPISELVPQQCSSGWPAAMRFYPFKRDGTYDKGERQDNLVSEVCLSNTLACYINAETFHEATDTHRAEHWKLPYDRESPIEQYTLCEIEVLPKNVSEASKGKLLKISRVRVHNQSLASYRSSLVTSRYPSTYEESALVQILTRMKSPCTRSDITIDRPTFLVRKVNAAAVVYNVQDGVTGLIHIVNWGPDGEDADKAVATYPDDTQALIKSQRDSPVPVTAFMQQHALRYNKDTSQLDKDDVVDMRFEERAPSAMHIDIETKHARTLLNCATTEQLARLLQLAIHMGALHLFVMTDQYWASSKSGNSCFRAIPLIDEGALLAPLTRMISNTAGQIDIMERIAQPTGSVADAVAACTQNSEHYALEIPTGETRTPTVVLCATEERAHECVSALDRLVFSVVAEYLVYDPSGKNLTLDFCLQAPAAADDRALLDLRCSTANPEWLTNITYADHAYIVTITSQCKDTAPHTYLNLLYIPGGGGARNTHNTILDAAFDPSNAASVFATLQSNGAVDGLALVGASAAPTGMRQLLQSLHSSHKAQRLTPTKISPYLTIAHGVASPADSPQSENAEDEETTDTPDASPSPAKKRAKRA